MNETGILGVVCANRFKSICEGSDKMERIIAAVRSKEALVKRCLKKLETEITVNYADSGYTNDLFGSSFTVGDLGDSVILSIDLASNFRVRNTDSNRYADACELVENQSILESIQIDDEDLTDAVTAIHRRHPKKQWRLHLLLGAEETLQYEIKIEALGDSLFLSRDFDRATQAERLD